MRVVTERFDDEDALFAAYLEAGCRAFDLPIGFVSQLSGDRYRVRASRSTSPLLAAGRSFNPAETFCQLVLERETPLALDDIEADPALRGRWMARVARLRRYLGAPYAVEGASIGALAFADTAPGAAPFTPADLALVDLLARALGRALEELALREARARLPVLPALPEPVGGRGRPESDAVWDWDLRADRLYLSPRWKAMLGLDDLEVGDSPDEWLGRLHPEDAPRVQAALGAHLDGATAHFECEYRLLHRDGAYRWMLARGVASRDAAGRPVRLAGTQIDITDRKLQEQPPLPDAYHDPLTGLPNRVLFIDRLGRSIARSKQGDFAFAVLFLDLDDFKGVNDSLGHLAGDSLLSAIARRLERCLRPVDTVARLGGDEFAILLDDIREPGDAVRVAERVLRALGAPFDLGGQPLYTSASIGIASSELGYAWPQDVLRDADTAMYSAKATGPGQYAVFDLALQERILAQLRLDSDLRRALETGELRLRYQPIVDLQTGLIVGFEALLRWQHPQRGLLLPAEFIPDAEASGLIVPIGDWVLGEVCRQLVDWGGGEPASSEVIVSVNLSARQFVQPDLGRRIRALLDERACPPRRLRLEIAESVVMADPEAATRVLRALDQLGVGLTLADFGAGRSSLSHLHRLPFDTLKVNRAFVAGLGRDRENVQVVRTIVSLARNLGLRIVAEGIEAVEQLMRLRELGCDLGQGYLFARPLDAGAAAALLAQGALA